MVAVRRVLALMLVLLLPLGSSAAPLRMVCHGGAPADLVAERSAHCSKHQHKAPAVGADCHCPPGCTGAALPASGTVFGQALQVLPSSAQPASGDTEAVLPVPFRPPIALLLS